MFHRSFRLLVGAVVLAALPSVVSASTGRLEGMALPGDYTKDYTAIYGWPSCINNVGNLIYAEVGNDLGRQVTAFDGVPNNAERAMGAVLPNLWDGRYGVWGIHLREQTPSLGQGDVLQSNDPNDNQNESFDLMWGRKFGTTSFGLRLNRSYAKNEFEIPSVTTTLEFDPNGVNNLGDANLARNVFGLGAGLGFEMSDKTQAEVSLLWQNRSFNADESAANKYTDNGNTTYQFAGRIMWKWQPNVLVIPVAKLYSFDLSQKVVGNPISTALAPGSYANTLKGWQVGVAGNWSLGSNDLFVLGAQVAQNKIDQESDIFGLNSTGAIGARNFSDTLTVTENFYPNVFMALETQVNHWLTLRFGANKAVMHTLKVEGNNAAFTPSQTLTIKDSPFGMNIGAGVKVGSLMFDAVLDNRFYLNPVAQVMGNVNAGYQGGPRTFTKVSATYSW